MTEGPTFAEQVQSFKEEPGTELDKVMRLVLQMRLQAMEAYEVSDSTSPYFPRALQALEAFEQGARKAYGPPEDPAALRALISLVTDAAGFLKLLFLDSSQVLAKVGENVQRATKLINELTEVTERLTREIDERSHGGEGTSDG